MSTKEVIGNDKIKISFSIHGIGQKECEEH